MHLSEYMTKHQLSDDEVAEAIDVSRPTISRIRRKRNRPDWPTIEALMKYTRGAVTANDWLEMA